MRHAGWAALWVVVVGGCAFGPEWTQPPRPPVPVAFENPLLVPPVDPQVVWETLAEVIGDYFQIKSEQPVRCLGGTLTEGRLDTFPEVGSTLFEPWRHDSADHYEKLEATLQSIRRHAHIHVIPNQAGGGYSIEVVVYKELEDVTHPAHAASATATFRNDSTLTRVVGPVGEQEINKGWIPLGRDPVLEQRIIAQLRERFGAPAGGAFPQAMPMPGPERVPTPAPMLPQAMPASSASAAPPQSGPSFAMLPAAGNQLFAVPPDHAAHGARGPQDEFCLPFQDDDDDGVRWVVAYGPGDAGPPDGQTLFDPAMATFNQGPGLPQQEGGGFGQTLAVLPGGDPVAVPGPVAVTEEPRGNFFLRNGGRLCDAFKDAGTDLFVETRGDYAQFYSIRSLACFAGGLGVAAALANTSADRSFQDWHDRQVHTPTLGHFVDVIRPLGNGTYMIPLFAVSAVYGSFEPSLPGSPVIGEWGDRTMRSCLVGGPPLLVLQFGLGGSRPELATGTSHWNLFRDSHSASGDAFIGGVALINAAKMTDNLPLKFALYGASVLPGYGRVVQDKHYLSQAILGWWLAYLAADAVDRNGFLTQRCGFTAVPMEDGVGIGLMKQW